VKTRRFTAEHAEIAEKYSMAFSAVSAFSVVERDFFKLSSRTLRASRPWPSGDA